FEPDGPAAGEFGWFGIGRRLIGIQKRFLGAAPAWCRPFCFPQATLRRGKYRREVMFMRRGLHLLHEKGNVTGPKFMIRCALFSWAFGMKCAHIRNAGICTCTPRCGT